MMASDGDIIPFLQRNDLCVRARGPMYVGMSCPDTIRHMPGVHGFEDRACCSCDGVGDGRVRRLALFFDVGAFRGGGGVLRDAAYCVAGVWKATRGRCRMIDVPESAHIVD